jgi:lysophospholipase L1-like esterase
MKKKLELILINAIAVLLILIFFELTVRYFYPEIVLSGTSSSLLKDNVFFNSPGIAPNSSGESNGVIKESDSLGFWKYNNANSSKKKIKWLFLGDSATMGIGVENDSTFAGIINSSLDTVQVLNPSLIGYSSKDYYNVIKKLLATDQNKLGINKILIFWCLNDIYDNYPTKNSPDVRTLGYVGKFITFLSKNFKTWHLFKELFADRQKDYFQYDVQFYKDDNINLKQSLQNIVDCYSIAKKFAVETEFIILPYEYQIRNIASRKYCLPQVILKKDLSGHGINTIDILDFIEKSSKDSKKLFLFGDGIHFSKTGHKMIARTIANKILFSTNKSEKAH